MTTVVRAAVYALTALVVSAIIYSCVLELTWAPVHDAPNEFHWHASASPSPVTIPDVGAR
jgi:hypothetical protein